MSFCYSFINILFIHDKIPFMTCLSKLLVYHQSLNFECVLKLVLKIEDKNVRFGNSYLLQFYPKTCFNHLNKQNPFICYIFIICESFAAKGSWFQKLLWPLSFQTDSGLLLSDLLLICYFFIFHLIDFGA